MCKNLKSYQIKIKIISDQIIEHKKIYGLFVWFNLKKIWIKCKN